MNCAQARLLIGADPRAGTAELGAHLGTCPACAQFQAEMLALEGRISRALEEPPHLGSRVRRRSWLQLAMAASVALLTLGLIAAWLLRPTDTLAHDVVAHVRGEPESWLTKEHVNAAGIAAALDRSGVGLDLTSDRITYAQSCFFHGHYVPHLIVQTAAGPATVLILRHESVGKARAFREAGMSGIIVPAETGSIAVLMRGSEAAQTQLLAQQMQQDVHWLAEPK